ncbi:MAG: hypothetical protein ACYDB7_00985, partial [Mycobacteriales bacterium]
QPIVADIGASTAGPYVIEGSATYDLRAVNAAGQEAPGFPKFTGGWMFNAPVVGPFGSLATQVVAAGTREGNLFVWSTSTPACSSSGPWPMAHHDLSNTNNLQAVNAVAPECLAASPPPTVAEAPIAALLPAVGLVVLGMLAAVYRRRYRHRAAGQLQ